MSQDSNPKPSRLICSSLVIFIYWVSERQGSRLGLYFLCCDRESRAASVLSFTRWQQATIEITRQDPLLLLVRTT